MACLRSPLPATFRIAGTGKHAAAVLATLRSDFVTAIAATAGEGPPPPGGQVGEAPLQPPVPLPWCARAWLTARGVCVSVCLCRCLCIELSTRCALDRYPDNLAWQMRYSRSQVGVAIDVRALPSTVQPPPLLRC